MWRRTPEAVLYRRAVGRPSEDDVVITAEISDVPCRVRHFATFLVSPHRAPAPYRYGSARDVEVKMWPFRVITLTAAHRFDHSG